MAVPEIVLIELPSQERRKRNSRHQTLAGVDFFFVRSGGLVDVSTIFPFSFKIMWRLLPGTGGALLSRAPPVHGSSRQIILNKNGKMWQPPTTLPLHTRKSLHQRAPGAYNCFRLSWLAGSINTMSGAPIFSGLLLQ